MLDRIKSHAAGKKIKEKIPEIEPEQGFEEGNFVKFVKANFKPRFLSDAFLYQDQNGEKQRLFQYADDRKRPIILNGPTGNGKSVLAMDYACSRGLPYYFDTGSSSFRLATAIGKFVPSSPSPVFSPGSLTLAAIFGGVYVLEEIPPIPQDELTGLNVFLERKELPIITQFGYETIRADPNFIFIATGNFHSNYTTNELNDAFLQRFRQLKFGYPEKESTIQILTARAPKLDYPTAEIIATALEEMRPIARSHSKDLGLKGAVDIAQLLAAGNKTPLKELFEDNIINPITTYENNIEKKDGKLYTKLMEVVNKFS
jgi:MoxR-like ATPase